jgi:outer membrane translocation and assembly module TamA
LIHNLEFRSRPVEILSVMIGGVAFYDVGDAFYRFDAMALKQGGGAGLRFGFPQLERSVFRIDCGFPLSKDEPDGELTITAGFRQVIAPP